MIHELRTYTFHPGQRARYLELSKTLGRPVRGNAYGINLGVWTPVFGAKEEVLSLWSYDSFEERARLRTALSQNSRWIDECVPQMRPLMARQDVRLLNPARFDPDVQGTGVYELQICRTEVGGAKAFATTHMDAMSEYGADPTNVGLWIGDIPQPNEVLRMSRYPSFDALMAMRAKVAAAAHWRALAQRAQALVIEEQSMLLRPTIVSAPPVGTG